MSGIITLAETLVEVVDDDYNFIGTAYTGPAIVQAAANMAGSENLKTAEHPNLIRKLVTVAYLRVRYGAGNPHYRDLLTAVKDKLLTNPKINSKFGNRIVLINNPNEPAVSYAFPYIGIFDGELIGPLRFANQREETVVVNLYIFSQTFPKNVTEQMIGD